MVADPDVDTVADTSVIHDAQLESILGIIVP